MFTNKPSKNIWKGILLVSVFFIILGITVFFVYLKAKKQGLVCLAKRTWVGPESNIQSSINAGGERGPMILSQTGPMIFSETGPSQTGPSQTGPSQTGPSQTGPTQDTKIIWSYWHADDVPMCVALALKSWLLNEPEFTINLLSEKNLFDFIDKSELPLCFYKKQQQHKADIIRIILLEKYGGLWLDSTIILNKKISDLFYPQNYDVAGYFLQGRSPENTTKAFENWLICAPKGSPLIADWKKEYFHALESQNYEEELRKQGVIFEQIGNTEYLKMHCAFLAINHRKKYRVVQHRAEDDPFKYLATHCTFGIWNPLTAVLDIILTDRHDVRIFKVRGSERNLIESLWPVILPNSSLGKIINKTEHISLDK